MEEREKLKEILRKAQQIDRVIRKEYLIEYTKVLTLCELLIEKGIITAKEFKKRYMVNEHKASKELIDRILKKRS